MEKINEIKIPKGVESISVKQHNNKIVIEFIPEKAKFKRGDFVYEDGRTMIVKNYPNFYHATVLNMRPYNKPLYDGTYGLDFSEPTFRHATEGEKQLLINAMKKDGKRWNDEKKCIENIPQPRFKAGDKVMLKSGCVSKPNLIYRSAFDEYIGKELIVIDYTEEGNVRCNNCFYFAEDWLEFYTEEPKEGDLAIFWGDNNLNPTIRLYNFKSYNGHTDNFGTIWGKAIKWDGTKEQFEKVLRGEIL